MPRQTYRVQVFKGDSGDWYWRLRATNKLIVAVGGQGYTRRHDALRMARRLFPAFVIA